MFSDSAVSKQSNTQWIIHRVLQLLSPGRVHLQEEIAESLQPFMLSLSEPNFAVSQSWKERRGEDEISLKNHHLPHLLLSFVFSHCFCIPLIQCFNVSCSRGRQWRSLRVRVSSSLRKGSTDWTIVTKCFITAVHLLMLLQNMRAHKCIQVNPSPTLHKNTVWPNSSVCTLSADTHWT